MQKYNHVSFILQAESTWYGYTVNRYSFQTCWIWHIIYRDTLYIVNLNLILKKYYFYNLFPSNVIICFVLNRDAVVSYENQFHICVCRLSHGVILCKSSMLHTTFRCYWRFSFEIGYSVFNMQCNLSGTLGSCPASITFSTK